MSLGARFAIDRREDGTLEVWFSDDGDYDDEPFPVSSLRSVFLEAISDNVDWGTSTLISPTFAQSVRALFQDILVELGKYREDPSVESDS